MTTPQTRQVRRSTARQDRKAASRKPVPRDAFKRAAEMSNKIKAAYAKAEPLIGQPVSYAITLRDELKAIKPYISRGKGQGGREHRAPVAPVKRAAAKRRNVLRERARR